MNIRMYSIKDKLNGYTPPLIYPNDDVAIREFRVMLQNNPSMKIKQDDFELYYIGEMDSETAIIYNTTNGEGEHPMFLERG